MTELNESAVWAANFPWPVAETHKHARGRLGVVSGDALHTGAARLAARAGLRGGAGLVRVFSPPDAAPVLAVALEAAMLAVFENPRDLTALAEPMDAVVVGPAAGLGEATLDHVLALAGTGAALVIDADALTVFRARTDVLFSVLDRDDVLTPHEGEFERLFPGLLAEGREAAAAQAARIAGCVVILKGHETLIAAPDGRLRINRDAPPWLATAGSGDVLAGLAGALIAQRMDSFDAASAAVWIHAEAARGFGPGLISEDLPDLIPGVLSRLFDRRDRATGS